MKNFIILLWSIGQLTLHWNVNAFCIMVEHGSNLSSSAKNTTHEDFLGSPVHLQSRGWEFNPWWGTKILHAVWCGQRKKKKPCQACIRNVRGHCPSGRKVTSNMQTNRHRQSEWLPRWLSGKEFACYCRRRGFNLWVRKIPWRRRWQPTPVFLPGKSHGQRSLVGCSPQGGKSLTQRRD